jgi:hypothetical protein
VNDNYELARDLLRGADQISEFIYGDVKHRRKVYHLAENDNLPTFKLGAVIAARKSTLLAWIADQEKRGRAA